MMVMTASRGEFALVGEPSLRRLTIFGRPAAYHLTGSPAATLVGWGGDGVFEWAAPEVEAVVLAAAETTGSVSAAKSRFRWA